MGANMILQYLQKQRSDFDFGFVLPFLPHPLFHHFTHHLLACRVYVFVYVYTIHIHSHGQGAVLPENEEKSDGQSITQRLCFCSSFLFSHFFTVLLIFLHVYVCTPFWTCHFSLPFHCLRFSWLIHWLLECFHGQVIDANYHEKLIFLGFS